MQRPVGNLPQMQKSGPALAFGKGLLPRTFAKRLRQMFYVIHYGTLIAWCFMCMTK
jgi:hypothetical protein